MFLKKNRQIKPIMIRPIITVCLTLFVHNGDLFGYSCPVSSSGETKTLVATTLPGYVFDGWYLNGVKVSSNQTYQLTIAANASLYAISKVRKIYVGTLQVKAVYVGTTECDVYDGTEKVFGESNEYANATAVG